MSSSTYNIGIKVQNNTTAEQRINLLSNPFDLQDNLNAKTQYRWNITSFSFASLTSLQLEYKAVGASIYTIYYSDIQPNLSSVLSALNNLGIGYFYSYTDAGQDYISTYNDQYIFNNLNIYNPVSASTNYFLSAGNPAPNYCNGTLGPFPTSVYGNNSVWTSVTSVYTDSGLTIPFNGGDLYYADSTLYFGTTLQINSVGVVTNFFAC
jgi:hypothetical protein